MIRRPFGFLEMLEPEHTSLDAFTCCWSRAGAVASEWQGRMDPARRSDIVPLTQGLSGWTIPRRELRCARYCCSARW